MDSLFSIPWGYWILGGLALYLFGPPLLVLSTFRLEAKPTLDAIDPNELEPPPVVQQHFEVVGADLANRGFEELATFLLPSVVPHTLSLVRIYVNRPARVSAMATSIFGMVNNTKVRHLAYVEFTTRYAGGEVFNTLNSQECTSFPPAPKTLTVRVPWIEEAGPLYEIHEAIIKANLPAGPRVLRLDTDHQGDVAAYIQSCMIEEMQHADEANYLRLAPDGSHYRATLPGAYLMTWRQLFPIKQWIARRDRRRVERVLANAGLNWRN